MSEPVKLVVVISGGMVQSIGTFGVPCEVLVIDYDCEDADPGCVTQIPRMWVNDPLVTDEGDAVITLYQASEMTQAEIAFLEPEFD
jgi:hypothetical protein